MRENTTQEATFCPRCQSTNLVRQTGADEPTRHYGRLKCGDCNAFIQCLKDPSTTLQQMQRKKAIEEILNTHSSSLANKELQFLTNIRDKRHLTPRQQSYLNSLGRRCLGVNICLVEHNHNA